MVLLAALSGVASGAAGQTGVGAEAPAQPQQPVLTETGEAAAVADPDGQTAIADAPAATSPDPAAPVDALLAEAQAAIADGRHEAAAGPLARAIALDAGRAETWALLAHLETLRSRPVDAQRAYERALAIDPEWAELHARLGHARAAAGDHLGARAAYLRALQLEAGNETARWGLQALPAPRLQPHAAAPDADSDGESGSINYRLELSLAYAAGPSLLFTAGALGGRLATDDVMAGLVVTAIALPATVHWINRRVGHGFAALLGWPGFTLGGALLGVLFVKDCGGGFCELGGLLIGGLVGAISWPILDIIAWGEYTPPRHQRTQASAAAQLGVWVLPTANSARAGVVARF
ncbi:MAG: hypothetical protein OEZ06_12630 [Myxococcales bacterium]|nr:hypothetical protein [Myxococcales bacterium]